MADSAAFPLPGSTGVRSQKRRAPAVPTETENKLARAARSAQRLAQLSDVPNEAGTLDLFPDDAARATQQALSIDVRQGMLQGFELPDVVLAAAGATDGARLAGGLGSAAAIASVDAKGVRCAVRAAGDELHDGQMVIETEADAAQVPVATAVDLAARVEAGDSAGDVAPMAAVTTQQDNSSVLVAVEPDVAPERSEATSAKSASLSHEADVARTSPELDHARATAFADTVDALYGVIADQRRAGNDHSRRMKWMLTIVVCALLMTVAIGIAQTMLLFRLGNDAKSQQQRIEQMMLNQQVTLATLLDTDSNNTSLPTVAQAAPPAVAASPAAPAARTQHGFRHKLAHTH